jgi:hypothetical protein
MLADARAARVVGIPIDVVRAEYRNPLSPEPRFGRSTDLRTTISGFSSPKGPILVRLAAVSRQPPRILTGCQGARRQSASMGTALIFSPNGRVC